ncbi:hypothetical protein HK101_004309 [Irineochytrium annulatum]|nr:hypothetical protein HK101_004309 [Irineochytrium annulatum]
MLGTISHGPMPLPHQQHQYPTYQPHMQPQHQTATQFADLCDPDAYALMAQIAGQHLSNEGALLMLENHATAGNGAVANLSAVGEEVFMEQFLVNPESVDTAADPALKLKETESQLYNAKLALQAQDRMIQETFDRYMSLQQALETTERTYKERLMSTEAVISTKEAEIATLKKEVCFSSPIYLTGFNVNDHCQQSEISSS